MRLSTSTNIFFNRPDGSKAGIADSVRMCANAGYRVMDLNFLDCTTFRFPFIENGWRQWLDNIKMLSEKSGVVFGQAHAPFYNFFDKAFPDSAEIDALIYRSVDCCEILDIPWLVIHAGTDFDSLTPAKSSYQKNREYFRPIIAYAARKNVGIAFENLWECTISPIRRYTSTLEELIELVDSFDAPNVGICWDTDHAYLMKQNQAKALKMIGTRLKATHICDCIGIDSDHMLPYSGSIDWPQIMHALADIGYNGDFTYEIHRFTSTMPLTSVSQALRYSVLVGEGLLELARAYEEEKNGI